MYSALSPDSLDTQLSCLVSLGRTQNPSHALSGHLPSPYAAFCRTFSSPFQTSMRQKLVTGSMASRLSHHTLPALCLHTCALSCYSRVICLCSQRTDLCRCTDFCRCFQPACCSEVTASGVGLIQSRSCTSCLECFLSPVSVIHWTADIVFLGPSSGPFSSWLLSHSSRCYLTGRHDAASVCLLRVHAHRLC